MPVTKTGTIETENALVRTNVTDKTPTVPLPDTPQGMMVIGPQVTLKFIEDEWSNENTYDYYDVVQSNGTSYIAVQDVPVGTALTDTEYWAKWNDPNAQVKLMQDTINMFDSRIDAAEASAGNAQTIAGNAQTIAGNAKTIAEAAQQNVTAIKATYFKQDPIYYGADPTGASDSTEAIQNCVNANNGRTVIFTNGVYKITAPIILPFSPNERTSIDFNGAIIRVNYAGIGFHVGGDNTSSPTTSNQSAGNASPWGMRNGTITSNNANSILIKVVQNYQNGTISNMLFTSPGTVIQIGDTSIYSADIDILDCVFYNNVTTTKKAIIINSADCTIQHVRSLSKHPTQIYAQGDIYIHDVHLLGWEDNNSFTGIEIGGLTFTADNYYADNLATGIKYVGHDTISATVTNGHLYNYSNMSKSVYLDLSSATSDPLLNFTNNQIYGRGDGEVTSVVLPSTEQIAWVVSRGFSNNFLSGAPNKQIDYLLATSYPKLYNKLNNQWTHIGYLIIKPYENVNFLVTSNNLLYIVSIYNNQNGINIHKHVLDGTVEDTWGASFVQSNSIGVPAKNLIELCIKGNGTNLTTITMLSRDNAIFLSSSYYLINALPADKTPDYTLS
ncbi:hypothetical protein [Methanomethylophilus alvi]|uniref:hypothetical protein n=1 Tax=Methanomethylophilus alvi TaxID=1291540 RepID=UPI0037DC514E